MTGLDIAHLEVGGRPGESALRIAILAVRLEVAANRWGSACQAALERYGIGNGPQSPLDPAWLPPHRRLLEHLEHLYNTHTHRKETQMNRRTIQQHYRADVERLSTTDLLRMVRGEFEDDAPADIVDALRSLARDILVARGVKFPEFSAWFAS